MAIAGYNNVGPFWKDYDYIPNYNKFYLIESGEGWLKIGDKEFYPKPHELYLMPQNILQSYSIIDSDTAFIKYWVHFTAKVGELNLFDIIKTPYFTYVEDYEYVTSLLNKIIFYHNTELFIDKAMMQALILQLICYFLEHIDYNQIQIKNISDMNRIISVIEFIDKNIDQEITIEKLADFIHLQPNYFINFFRKYMNTSPIQYVNSIRVNRSVELLKISNYSIKEIAECCGYHNELYFSKNFKKLFGLTPSEYRKAYHNRIIT